MKKKLLASAHKFSQLIQKQNRMSALTMVLGFLVFAQTVQTLYLQKRMDFLNELYQLSEGVESESGEDGNFLMSFAQDLNEIRQFLLLPPKQYEFGTGADVDLASEEEKGEDLNTLMFDFVGTLGTYEKNEALYQANSSALQTLVQDPLWSEAGLIFENTMGSPVEEGMEFVVRDLASSDSDDFILKIRLGYDGRFSVQTYNDTLDVDTPDTVDSLKTTVHTFIAEDLATLKAIVSQVQGQRNAISTLLLDPTLLELLTTKTLSLSQEQKSEEAYFYQFRNSSLAALAELSVSKKDATLRFTVHNPPSAFSPVIIDGKEDLSSFWLDVKDALNALDARTDLQKKVDEQKAQLEAILEDPAFQKTLKDAHLSFGAPTQADGRVEYSLLNADGETVRILYIDASTGAVKVRTPETGEVQELSFAVQDLLASGKKKTLDLPESIPEYADLAKTEGEFNVLLMGKNGSNVDTMIFANVNESTRMVTLISVPRDLYWNGAKINSVYSGKGVEAQVSAVEDVLGYEIDRYALVDMYAFRDIIDAMGGVDVTLKEDLIDPTYRTCDNGVCSTLYYKAGTYHLNGTQALRIARSRHSTSDYSRAERQQLILEGLRQKAQSLGFGDAKTLLSIINIVLDSTETNFTTQEALTDYFRYQSFTIEGGNVISTANVLSAVPVPVNYLTSHPLNACPEDGSQPDCKVQYAIDTLQPRNQDWNLIRWWARGVLEASPSP